MKLWDRACGGEVCGGNADANDAWYVGMLDCVFFLEFWLEDLEFWLEDLEFWLFLDISSKLQFNISNVNHIWLNINPNEWICYLILYFYY